jgi:crotonobetainyl-CoA:carnitine CoA-transferase CaiB-like acyl-CoA transferase
LRVVELATAIAGPVCTRYLAYFGAEVIKVESREYPDTFRYYGSRWLSREEYGPGVWQDSSPTMNDFSAGKRSVGLNLRSDAGRQAMERLLARSDIFVSNFTADALARLGLTYERVRAIRPDIIYLSMTGFGLDGPYAGFVAWGKNLSALTGIDDLTGWADRPPSGISLVAYSDQTSGLYGFIAVLAALAHRDATGEGQFIELSQFEATVALLGSLILEADLTGRIPRRQGNAVPEAAPQGVYPCRGQDEWVALTVADGAQWQALCRVMGRPDWAGDPGLASMAGRAARRAELDAEIARWTSQHTAAEVAAWLQAEGVPAMPVLDHGALARDEHLVGRGFWSFAPQPRFGLELLTGVAIRLRSTPGGFWRAGPPLGWDNDYVLGELCGYSEAERRRLVEEGAVFPPARPELRLTRPFRRYIGTLLPNYPGHTPPDSETAPDA